MTEPAFLGGVTAPQETEDQKLRRLLGQPSDPALLVKLHQATTRHLTPAEHRAQRKNWLLGQTHATEAQIDAYLSEQAL